MHCSRIIKGGMENFSTEETAVDIENFFRENPYPGTERAVQQSVENIRLNAAWLKRDEAKIQAYLKP